jgi:hypothetical protein
LHRDGKNPLSVCVLLGATSECATRLGYSLLTPAEPAPVLIAVRMLRGDIYSSVTGSTPNWVLALRDVLRCDSKNAAADHLDLYGTAAVLGIHRGGTSQNAAIGSTLEGCTEARIGAGALHVEAVRGIAFPYGHRRAVRSRMYNADQIR